MTPISPLLNPFQQEYKELSRLRHIIEVLLKNSLGFVVEFFNLQGLLPAGMRSQLVQTDPEMEKYSAAERIRLTLEELGATYIKMGQMLAGRRDLLPAEYAEEFKKLLDSANPIPPEQVIGTIEAELGAKPDEVFAEFDMNPIGSASLGQVHKARLKDGTRVVVKVQRPGVEGMVSADLDLLHRQARFLERHSTVLREYHIAEIIEELGIYLMDEMNYTVEALNANRLGENFRNVEHVIIPVVYWEYTTQRVITMQDVSGVKFTDPDKLKAGGCDLPLLADRMVNTYLQQVFVDGFFHADPHPANLMAHGNRIAIVDFGMIGRLSPDLREDLGDLLVSLISEDAAGIVRAIQSMGISDYRMDTKSLERGVERILHRYHGMSLEYISIGALLEEVMALAFQYKVRLPTDVVMLIRVVILLEGVALGLDPAYDFVEAAKPFTQKLVMQRMSFRRIGITLSRMAHEMSYISQTFPRRIDFLMKQLEMGDITFGVDLRQIESFTQKLDVVTNRVSFSIVVASIIIGSALLMHGGADAAIWRLPYLDWGIPVARGGFFLAMLMGIWLLFSIIRSKGL